MQRLPHLGLRRASALLLLLASAPLAAQNIDTGTPPPNASWPKFTFGRPLSGTQFSSLGQSFTVATGPATVLTDFTFWVGQIDDFEDIEYRAYIFPWNEATRTITSDFVFRSAIQVGTTSPGPLAVGFSTGGLNLGSGQSYLAVLSSAESPGTPAGSFGGVYVSTGGVTGTYPGGSSYIQISLFEQGLAGLRADAWAFAGGVTTGQDLAFRATFVAGTLPPVTPIPEPTTIALFGTGLLGVAFVARRRRAG